jgi:hypothetical protein
LGLEEKERRRRKIGGLFPLTLPLSPSGEREGVRGIDEVDKKYS